MALSDAILPEFDHEMSGTRRTLERVPDDKLGWKPHEKSFSMGHLASHLANIPTWAVHSIELDALDINPTDGPPPKTPVLESRESIVAAFDANVAAARAAIASASDEHLMKPWSLLSGGNAVLTMPRIALIRAFVMNHTVHHRAQLGLYLRLNDLPVPSIYGPSADESGM